VKSEIESIFPTVSVFNAQNKAQARIGTNKNHQKKYAYLWRYEAKSKF
jgi:hypothetical protein